MGGGTARQRCPWATAGPGCGAYGQQRHYRLPNFARNLSWSFFETPQKHCNSNDANSMFEQAAGELRAKLMGGGGAWPGFEETHRTTNQHTRNHWCGGRRRDLPRCRWAAAGPGRASRRRAERSSQRGRLAGGPPPTGTHSGRGLRRPEHPWGHNETRPRPVARPRPRHAHAAPLSKAARRRSAPFTTAPPAIRRSCPRGPRPRRGQPRGGQRGRGTGSRTRSRHPRCGRSGSTAGRHRAHHTRRA